jgi:hypothetical protein
VETHTPLPLQSKSLMQARHVLDAVSQMGAVPEQLVFDTQATHVSLEGSQKGVGALHSPLCVAVHSTQRPALLPLVSQNGVTLGHSPSDAQARQVSSVDFDDLSQTGLLPEQPVLSRHCTQ